MRRDYDGIAFELVTCFYCDNIFVKTMANVAMEWEHLDDDRDNSVVENMVWAHKFCNNKKKTDFDMKTQAMEKYERNLRWADINDPNRQLTKGESYNADKEKSHVADVAAITTKCCIEVLITELQPFNGNSPKRENIPLKKCATLAAFRVQEECGNGSQQACERRLEILCCEYSKDYEIREIGNKRVIFRSGK